MKNRWIALVICLFTGIFGGHHYYLGNWKKGLLYTFTSGGFIICWIYDIFKILYRSIKKRYVIFNGGRPVEILGKPNMNVTLINMTGLDKYAKLKIDLSPVISESSVEKVYIE